MFVMLTLSQTFFHRFRTEMASRECLGSISQREQMCDLFNPDFEDVYAKVALCKRRMTYVSDDDELDGQLSNMIAYTHCMQRVRYDCAWCLDRSRPQ